MHQNPPQTGFPVVAFLYPAHSCGLIILLAVPSRVDKQQQQHCIGSFPPAANSTQKSTFVRSTAQHTRWSGWRSSLASAYAGEKNMKRFWRFCCLKTNVCVCVRQTDWKESSIDDRETRPSKTTIETASVFLTFGSRNSLLAGLRAGKQIAKRNASLLPPCRPEG